MKMASKFGCSRLQARTALGYTQREVAEAVSVSSVLKGGIGKGDTKWCNDHSHCVVLVAMFERYMGGGGFN